MQTWSTSEGTRCCFARSKMLQAQVSRALQNLKASLLKVSITDSRSDSSNTYMYNQFCKQHANVSTTWFLTKKRIKIEWTMVENLRYKYLCRSGAKNCYQMGHSKICKKSLWLRNSLHWRLLWIWAVSYPSNSWGVGSWKRIFARSFWETW